MIIKRKLGFIANKVDVEIKKNGKEIGLFSEPKKFMELYMPLSDEENLENYGEDVYRTLRMFVDKNKWYGKIKVGDRAYLIDDTTNETDLIRMVNETNKYCANANYRVTVCAIQNLKIKVEFLKISEGD